VNFIRKHGGRESFEFLALQSGEGKIELKSLGYPEKYLDSVLLVEQGQVYKKSDAVLRIIKKLRSPWKWMFVFIVIPRPLRDFIYNLVSHLRKYFSSKHHVSVCKSCG